MHIFNECSTELNAFPSGRRDLKLCDHVTIWENLDHLNWLLICKPPTITTTCHFPFPTPPPGKMLFPLIDKQGVGWGGQVHHTRNIPTPRHLWTNFQLGTIQFRENPQFQQFTRKLPRGLIWHNSTPIFCTFVSKNYCTHCTMILSLNEIAIRMKEKPTIKGQFVHLNLNRLEQMSHNLQLHPTNSQKQFLSHI